jgi:hypothetical protein
MSWVRLDAVKKRRVVSLERRLGGVNHSQDRGTNKQSVAAVLPNPVATVSKTRSF